MKIGIFIDNFLEPQKYKDPGVIACSLRDLGNQVKIYTFNSDSKNFDGLEIKTISKKESKNSEFWRKEGAELIFVYSWLSIRFSKIIESLRLANKKIILKLDSDGHLISPLKPTYLRTFGRSNSPYQILIFVLRLIQWRFLFKIIDQKKIKQLSLCDAAIIESPKALANLEESLRYQKREELISKINFVADPINNTIINNTNNDFNKENIIICIGRWDDKQKNKNGLIKTLKKADLNNWKLIIVGCGAKNIENKLQKKINNIQSFESLPHDSIGSYLNKSKIFFAPSNYESFNLAAAESLCQGCSLAGTPLESFYYFINNGRFGTLANNFTTSEITRALNHEIKKWNNNEHNPKEISKYWSSQLSPENIGKQINDLINKI